MLEKGGESLICCKWGKLFDGEQKIFEDLKSYKTFSSLKSFFEALDNSEGYFPIHAYLMTSKLVQVAGPWNDRLKVNQDGEFMLRVFMNIDSIVFAENTYVLYRKDINSSTSKLSKKNLKYLVESWELIQYHFNKIFPDSDLPYIENAKRRIFIKYRDNPKLINTHRDFFGNIPKEEPSDFRLSFYRIIVKYWLSRNILRFFKNLKRGKLSLKKVE